MVYFERGNYGKIIVIRISEDKLIYQFPNGKRTYEAKIFWTRVKGVDHPVQYVNVRGRRIFAFKK